MYLNELSLRMIKSMKIYRITTFIVLVSMIAMLVAFILSLREIVAFDIASAVISMVLLVSAIGIFRLRRNLKQLQEIMDHGEAKVLFSTREKTLVNLQESYIYKSYDEENNCYTVDKDTYIPALFVKKVINNEIILYDVGVLDQGVKVNLVDFSIFGYCLVEANEKKYLFSNSDIFIEII